MNLRQVLNNSKIPPHEKVNYIKIECNPKDYNKIFRNNGLLKNFINRGLIIYDLTNVKINEPYTFTRDFESEFLWLANKIILNAQVIREFIKKRKIFNTKFLQEEYDICENILEEIKEEFGYSLWQIESELHLRENMDGSGENWKHLSQYLSLINNPIYDFCINASSKRIESSISFESYLNQFENDLGNMNIYDFLNDFFVFKSFRLASFKFNYEDLSSVLYVSNIFSIIDQYLSIIEVIIYNVSKNERKYFTIFRLFIDQLIALGFEDERLLNLLNILDNDSSLILLTDTDSVFRIFEMYYDGNYSESKKLSQELILKLPINFELYEIYVKSLINLNLKFVGIGIKNIDEILLSVYNFLSFTNSSEKSGKILMKFANKYVNLDLGFQIMGFLYEVENNLNNNISFYFSATHNSFKLLQSENFVSLLSLRYDVFNNYKFSSYKRKVLGISTENDNPYTSLDVRQENTCEIINAYILDNYQSCIDIIRDKNLLQESNNYYKERYVYYYYGSLIHEKKIVEALTLFDLTYFDNDIFYYKLNYKNLFELVFYRDDKFEFIADFNALVLRSLYETDYEVYAFLDEYLSINNIVYNDFDLIESTLRKDQFIYLLYKIYTIDTLKYYFGNVQDVEDFRIVVLHKLINVDIENKLLYDREITEITKNFSVRNVIKDVNNARLFVDIAKLRDILLSKYTDDFTRLLRIVAEKKTNNLVSFNPSKKRDWDKSFKESHESEVSSFDQADFIAFKNIYYYVREQFLFSKEYGLDSSLSTRIRHGALKNEIRAVFDSLSLMTTKENGFYKDNIIWQSQISDGSLNDEIQTILKVFSESIDNLNDEIVNNIIQIRHELHNVKEQGVFNYYTNDDILYKFYLQHFSYLKTTEDTVDLLLNDLALFTNISVCSSISNLFNNVIFEDYKKIILESIDSLNQLKIPNKVIIIDNFNKAITNLQTCFDEISEWFYLETSSSSNLLFIETIINASFVMTKRLYNNIRIKEKIDIKFDQVAGYSSLIYVFNILFSNSILHSNLTDEIEISVEDSIIDDKYLKISVKNNYKNIDYEKIRTNLEKIKLNWTNLEDIDRSNIEGQSGFDKIKRIMIYEAKCITDKIDYQINEETIEISLFLIYKKPETDENISN